MARVLAAQRSGIGAARMAEKHVVYAPMERRARLAGDLRARQTEVLRLKRPVHPFVQNGLSARVDRPEGYSREKPGAPSERHRQPQSARNPPGDRSAADGNRVGLSGLR